MKMLVKINLEFTYEAEPENYETDDPIKIAEIDRQNFLDSPDGLDFVLEMLKPENITVERAP